MIGMSQWTVISVHNVQVRTRMIRRRAGASINATTSMLLRAVPSTAFQCWINWCPCVRCSWRRLVVLEICSTRVRTRWWTTASGFRDERPVENWITTSCSAASAQGPRQRQPRRPRRRCQERRDGLGHGPRALATSPEGRRSDRGTSTQIYHGVGAVGQDLKHARYSRVVLPCLFLHGHNGKITCLIFTATPLSIRAG